MFYSHSILKSTFPTPSIFPSSATEIYNPKRTTNKCVLYVCADLAFLSHTCWKVCIDSKLISVCLIYDYSLISDLHIFVYERAECATISLKCKKVKLFILNNFAEYLKKLQII